MLHSLVIAGPHVTLPCDCLLRITSWLDANRCECTMFRLMLLGAILHHLQSVFSAVAKGTAIVVNGNAEPICSS